MLYPKIYAPFKRNPGGDLSNKWYCPEFELLRHKVWTYTEKVDGMNTAITWDGSKTGIQGRTPNAIIPPALRDYINDRIDGFDFAGYFPDSLIIFGEGYGPKIQTGGCYGSEQKFILFDVKIGDFWLERDNIVSVATSLGFDAVPEVMRGVSLEGAVEQVAAGFKSVLRTDGGFAEGVVAVAPHGMLRRNSDRIVTKIKHRDLY